MTYSGTKKLHTMKVLRAYAKAAGKYRTHVLLSILGAVGIEASGVIAPLYLRQLVNTVSSNSPSPELSLSLYHAIGFFALFSLMGWISQRIRMTTISYMESWVMRDLSNSAYESLMRHSHDFFQSNFVGSLTRRVGRYSKSFETVYDSFILTFFPSVIYLTGTIYVLGSRSVYLGIALVVWTVLFLLVQFYLTRWRQEYKLIRANEDSAVTGLLSDSVSNHMTVTLFASLTREFRLYSDAVERWMKANLDTWNVDNIVYSIQGMMAVISHVAVLAGGVLLWERGVLTPGDFLLIQVYMFSLVNHLWDIGRTARRLNDSFADASEMIDIFETPLGIQDVPNASVLMTRSGTVVFDRVSFGFEEASPVLSDITLTIAPGERVALVGASGAGKSTVTKLLLRLHNVDSGKITIDDQDISMVTQGSLRASVGYVPQESILFHRSLADNIRYGKPDATMDDVIAASKAAHAHEFISKLSHGYDTYVGERGVKLSGGERQRVAIARAMLKNAPILILDEATSALDSENEALIQDALAYLLDKKTVIVIAHRLSTIMNMDRIIVMEHGKIVAEGSHEELLKQGGLYAKLWSIQAGGFIGDVTED